MGRVRPRHGHRQGLLQRDKRVSVIETGYNRSPKYDNR
jgi:hypothetical protein